MQYPAAVPLRTFPSVWIANGGDPSERRLAMELAAHLRSTDRRVEIVGRDQLEPMRLAGRIPAASVVVLLELDLQRRTQTRSTTQPETVCGSTGCTTRHRTDYYEVPTLRARVRLTVFDGPSARMLQRVAHETLEEGRRPAQMVQRALVDLSQKILASVDQRVERIEVQLLSTEHPEVRAALADIELGEWRAGRVRLEQFVESETWDSLEPQVQARVLYDLGMARRFDPVARRDDPAAQFAAAEEALQRAVRLDPRERYDSALRAVRAHQGQLRLVMAQQEAATHNYQVATPSETPNGEVPPVPPSYAP